MVRSEFKANISHVIGPFPTICYYCNLLEVKPLTETGSEGQKTKNKKKRKKKSQNKNKNKPTCGYEASNEIGENENESQNETFYDKHVIRIVPQPGW